MLVHLHGFVLFGGKRVRALNGKADYAFYISGKVCVKLSPKLY